MSADPPARLPGSEARWGPRWVAVGHECELVEL